jgi:hypothetical protein
MLTGTSLSTDQSGHTSMKLTSFTNLLTLQTQDNACIESFHSIMERELVSRYEFESFYHADMKIARYIFTYIHLHNNGSPGI